MRRRCFPRLLWPALALAVVASPARASLTGVCPDGSMFVVKREADIPCPRAKLVEPNSMPPIRPTHLPRPYQWEVFQTEQDPNNPYNLVGETAPVPEESDREDAATAVAPPEAAPPREHAAVTPPGGAALPATPASAGPQPLRLSAEETRDLALIVELTQQQRPAGFVDGDAGGAPALQVRLAHSPAFEARLREHFGGAPLGPALLFLAAAAAEGVFHPNFTFVQEHIAFSPERENPRAYGVLEGEIGALGPGERVLGYVVLPEPIDLSAPMDVYWNDRRISVAWN
jgi:hypothetical protein